MGHRWAELVGTDTLAGVKPTGEDGPVTRLGLWLTGPWPVAANGSTGQPRSADRSELSGPVGSSVLDQVVALAGVAERSGFDSLWVTDEVAAARGGASGHAGPEAYSLLGALAARTQAVRLGAIPVGVDARPPAIVAKVVTGIDVISHGRAVLTYGLGAPEATRGARTIEALRVGRALLEDEAPTFRGQFYSVVEAINQPGPVQVGRVPVVVFIERHADLSSVAVTEFVGLADAVVVPGGTREVRQVVDELRTMPRRGDSGSRDGPLQVIGIGLLPGLTHPSSPEGASDGGLAVGRPEAEVGELLEAGVDGCLVPVDLATPVETLAAASDAVRALAPHDVARGGPPGGDGRS